MKETIKYIVLFLIGGTIYFLIETIYKQSHTSHISMFVAGGLIFVLSGLINEVYTFEMPLIKQAVVAGVFITTPIEFIFGMVFNRNFTIWDYRGLPLTLDFLDYQVNLIFVAIWVVLCGIAIVLDDYIRYWFFGEEKPHYKFFKEG